jgi:hypothetical protein
MYYIKHFHYPPSHHHLDGLYTPAPHICCNKLTLDSQTLWKHVNIVPQQFYPHVMTLCTTTTFDEHKNQMHNNKCIATFHHMYQFPHTNKMISYCWSLKFNYNWCVISTKTIHKVIYILF